MKFPEQEKQEQLFADWIEIETIVLGRESTRGMKAVYNAYQEAMNKLTQKQKKNVNEEVVQYRISQAIVIVNKQTAITAEVYYDILYFAQKHQYPKIIANYSLQRAKKRLKIQLERGRTSDRKIRL